MEPITNIPRFPTLQHKDSTNTGERKKQGEGEIIQDLLD